MRGKHVWILMLPLILAGCLDEDQLPKCNELDNGIFNERDNCWTDHAEEMRDVAICDNIEDSSKAKCYGRVATELEDITVCNVEGLNKGWCSRIYLQTHMDAELNRCDKLGSYYKEECYIALALLSEDPVICGYAQDESSCWGIVARGFESDAICKDAPDPEKCREVMK